MTEPEGSSPPWSGVRRSAGSAAAAGSADLAPAGSEDPIERLRDGLALCTSPRMFVAAFEMDVPGLFRFAVQTLPVALQSTLVERFGRSEDLPCGRLARIYGVLTGLSGGTPSAKGAPAAPARVRFIPPYRLGQEFIFMLENASRRAEDDPVKSYWVPLMCVAHGSVTAVDPETALLDHPSVVYRIDDGVLKIETPRA